MTKLLEKIHDYLISIGYKKENLKEQDLYSVNLSMEIMEYAHRNQTRENGEEYVNHPLRCLQIYRDLVGIKPDDYFCIDKDLLYEKGIPFDGVQEVCILHDVLEDSDITIEEIKEIFDCVELGSYFDLYIKEPLLLITHDKSMDYDTYVLDYVMKNPISALVKMIDMQDNLYMLSLAEFSERKYERSARYLKLLYLINCKYRFIENVQSYKKDFKKTKIHYYLVEDEDEDDRKSLYAEIGNVSLCYLKNQKIWEGRGPELMDARVGYDKFEPEDSPYKFTASNMKDMVEISKQEAEKYIGQKINENEIIKLFYTVIANYSDYL